MLEISGLSFSKGDIFPSRYIHIKETDPKVRMEKDDRLVKQ